MTKKSDPKWFQRGGKLGKLGIPAGSRRLKGFTAKAVAQMQAKRKKETQQPVAE